MPKVFIVILHYNNEPDTLECLASLEKISYSDYELVVVDNGSEKESRIMNHESRIKGKVIYNEENLGFSGGNNAGIRYALERGADYVLLLNNDTVVSSDFLTKLVKAGESDGRFGILGPKIYFYDEPEKLWSAGGKINWLYNKGTMRGYGEIDRGQYDNHSFQKTDFITGCCLLIKRKVIEKIGLMPEDYFLYYEDTDWSLKTRRAGFQCIFAPAAKIWHKGSRGSQEGSPSYIYYHTRSGLIFSRRFAPFYIKPFIHLDILWRIFKQMIKLIFMPRKRIWARYILLGIRDFYLGKRGKCGKGRPLRIT